MAGHTAAAAAAASSSSMLAVHGAVMASGETSRPCAVLVERQGLVRIVVVRIVVVHHDRRTKGRPSAPTVV
jgi:hypothetical protein